MLAALLTEGTEMHWSWIRGLPKSWRRGSLIALLALLCGGAGAQHALAATEGLQTAPEWLPLRSPATIGCVLNNCDNGTYHGYWALDLAGAPGDPVYAAGAQARVLSRGQTCGGPGNSVWVEHGGGVVTRYSHLDSIDIADGQWVNQHTVLGRMGATGQVIPCGFVHLHFERRANGLSGPTQDPGPLKACAGPSLIVNGNWNASRGVSVQSSSAECGGGTGARFVGNWDGVGGDTVGAVARRPGGPHLAPA